ESARYRSNVGFPRSHEERTDMKAGPRRTALLLAATIVAAMSWSQGHAALRSSVIQDSFRSSLAAHPAATVDALVSFDGAARPADVASLAATGFTPLRVFDSFGVIYGQGPAASVLRAVGLSRVTAVTQNARLQYFGDPETIATRARDAWDNKSTSTTPVVVGGNVVNGAGVGVAIVDG